MNVFDLRAVIGLDTKSYESALSDAEGKAKSFGASAAGLIGSAAEKVGDLVGSAAAKVGELAVSAGKELTGLVSDSVKTGMDFDSAMSQVAATMGTTASKIGDLRDFAIEMGKSTKYTATQAAEALNYMALAGYDTAQSMEMLPNVLNLASAGAMDLARASDMVTDVQGAFGLSFERTTQMVDEMAKAASTGNTSIEQLGDAFLVIGALARDVNGGYVTMANGSKTATDNVQDLAIALTSMANAGIKGSEGGTHMRNMLMKLTGPGNEGVETFTNLGVSVFDTAGKMRSLRDIFGDLSKALSKFGDDQQSKLNAIQAIFNTRDTAAAEKLLASVTEDWDKIGQSILDASGAAQAMADEQMNNLAGSTEYLKSAFDGLKIQISDVFAPTLKRAVDDVTRLISGIDISGFAGDLSKVSDNLLDYIEIFRANGPEQMFRAMGWDSGFWTDLIDRITPTEDDIQKLLGFGEYAARKIADGLTAAAGFIGESAPSLLTELGTKLTDPDAFAKITGTASSIIRTLTDGLTSKESLDQFFDPDSGIPKILSNILENIGTIATDIIDFAGDLIGNILTYMVDPANKETIERGAQDVLIKLGETFVNVVGCIHTKITDLMSDIAVSMTGEFPYDATALDILGGLGKALLRNLWQSSLPGKIAQLMDHIIDQRWQEEYQESDTDLTYDEWAANGGYAGEHASNIDTDWQDYLNGMRAAGYGVPTGAALEEMHKAWERNAGHFAVGGVVTKPTYALVGESGAEAIMPLEQNTGWIDRLAERLGGQQVVITFGDIIVNGNEDAGAAVMEQIDRALRELQIAQTRGVGGTGWR